MPVKLPAPKHKTEDLADMLVISMPTLKIWPLIFVFGAWSLMWIAFELGIIFELVPEGLDISDVVFIIIWNILGAFILYGLLWQLFGKEEIQVTNKSITISYIVIGYKRSKEYLAEHIQDLGLARVSAKEFMMPRGPWNMRTFGSISFDYGAGTFKFASSIDDAEAKQIIREIQQKYPQYKKEM
jgi:hypothetical protein